MRKIKLIIAAFVFVALIAVNIVLTSDENSISVLSLDHLSLVPKASAEDPIEPIQYKSVVDIEQEKVCCQLGYSACIPLNC